MISKEDDKLRRLGIALLVSAVLLRLGHYLARGALWGDEAALAMNISPRSLGELRRPLILFQICPIGYLFFTKLSTLLFGEGERALRAFSLLSGLAVPPLTYVAVERALDRRAALAALGLTAISPWLIYYSAELKPYATDAAVTAGALALTACSLGAPDDRRLRLALPIAGLIGIAVSLPSIFVLGGAVAALGFREATTTRRWARISELAAVGAAFGGAFFLHLSQFIARTEGASTPQVARYWSDGFFPFPPSSLEELRWLPGKFFYAFVEPGGLSPRLIAGSLFLVGLFVIFRRNRSFGVAVVAPLVLLLVASAIGRYPVLSRLILFTVPIMAIGIAAGSTALLLRGSRSGTALPLIVLALSIVPLWNASELLLPKRAPDLADFARRLERDARPEDGLFVDDDVEWSYLYYDWKHEIAVDPVDITPIPPRYPFEIGEPQPYLQQLRPLMGKKRVWMLLSDFEKPGRGATFERYFTHYFDTHGGRMLERVPGRGMVLFLYDLSAAR